MRRVLTGLCLVLAAGAAVAAGPVRREWLVGGVTREALVAAPEQADGAVPAVFVFHGYGGDMRGAARLFGLHARWPEAMVLYMQGLPLEGGAIRPEDKRAGWQNLPGECGDRDVAFVDAVMASLRREGRVDGRRVYAAGHSNGGAFTYLLWQARPKVFAGFAPSGAVLPQTFRLTPRPALHLAGERDTLIRYVWQERSMARLRELNRCGAGQPWGEGGTRYPSASGAPVFTWVHPGGHEFPPAAADAVAGFLKELAACNGR